MFIKFFTQALSNQKYRELQEEFGDVGLLTGDVSINPSAGCLVMTTEVCNSLIIKGLLSCVHKKPYYFSATHIIPVVISTCLIYR